MNAEHLLKKQGWRGAGHSLDTSGRGIKKPLLISHKQDQNGLGHKKAAWKTDDQWWMRAFDESLQSLGTGQTSTLSQIQEKGINRGGLYGFFVKGEGLSGTIGSENEAATVDSSVPTSALQSGLSTPPTSASNSESDSKSTGSSEESSESSDSDAASDLSKSAKLSKSQNKRKRSAKDDASANKKLKQEDGAAKASVSDNTGLVTEVKTVLGTIDAKDCARIRAVRKSIDRQVIAQTKAKEKAGAYGLYISSKQAKDQKYFDDPINPGKKLTQKTAKIQRQRALRAAQKDLTKELIVNAVFKGDIPNHDNWSREEISQNYANIEKAIKTIEEAHNELKKAGVAKKKVKKVRIDAEAKRQSIIAAQLALLTPARKADYEVRAAEKGQSLDDYIFRRFEKNEAKKAEKQAAEKAAEKAAKKTAKKVDKEAKNLFFIDTEGDAAGRVIWTPLEDGSCPLDPSIWEDRNVEDLPRPVRKARRRWMEQQRDERKLAASRSIEKELIPTENKMKDLQTTTRQELTKMGKKKGATREELNLARREAKKKMREERRAEKGAERDGPRVTSSAKLADKLKTGHKVTLEIKEKEKSSTSVAVATSIAASA